MPEATFPPQNYSGLCKLHSCVRFQSKLWVVSPEGGGNEVEMYVKKNSFHFLWTFKGLISASTTVPKYPHRSLGDEGRICHFKSTTAKRAQEFLCPCLSLLCRWRTKEAWFNLLLLLFFFLFFCKAPSYWPWCSLSLRCQRWARVLTWSQWGVLQIWLVHGQLRIIVL